MRLLPYGAQIGGSIELGGRDIVNLSEPEMRALRGDRIALIPQDAMQALNPTMRIGRQVGEPYEFHRKQPYRAIWAKVVELLRAVKIPDPEVRVREYPHQFSGGMDS